MASLNLSLRTTSAAREGGAEMLCTSGTPDHHCVDHLDRLAFRESDCVS
jgi:hypothetical protein